MRTSVQIDRQIDRYIDRQIDRQIDLVCTKPVNSVFVFAYSDGLLTCTCKLRTSYISIYQTSLFLFYLFICFVLINSFLLDCIAGLNLMSQFNIENITLYAKSPVAELMVSDFVNISLACTCALYLQQTCTLLIAELLL